MKAGRTQDEALVSTCGYHISQCVIVKEYVDYCYSEVQQHRWINIASEPLTKEQQKKINKDIWEIVLEFYRYWNPHIKIIKKCYI